MSPPRCTRHPLPSSSPTPTRRPSCALRITPHANTPTHTEGTQKGGFVQNGALEESGENSLVPLVVLLRPNRPLVSPVSLFPRLVDCEDYWSDADRVTTSLAQIDDAHIRTGVAVVIDVRVDHVSTHHHRWQKIPRKRAPCEQEVIHRQAHELLVLEIEFTELAEGLLGRNPLEERGFRDIHVRPASHEKEGSVQFSLQLGLFHQRQNFSHSAVQKDVSIHVAVKTAFHCREPIAEREQRVENGGKEGKAVWVRPADQGK